MSPRTIVKSLSSQLRLSFNIKGIDGLFPGFTLGDFAVLYGSPTVLPLSMLLCVRAQLPYQLGGLETNVVFVDGGNTFRLYDVSYVARLHELDPKQVLERIYISRAFTAYQMTSLILDKLQDAVEEHNSKLVVISDFAGLYLDKDVPEREARDVFNQSTLYLSKFARENRAIVAATYLPHYPSKQDVFFKVVCGRANVAVSVRPSKYGQQFVVEKHPFFKFGIANFPSENPTLAEFVEA
ncbi:MAG: hypothetical protein ACLFU9_02955 [Candidatus Bathyarchaeia archaeon]